MVDDFDYGVEQVKEPKEMPAGEPVAPADGAGVYFHEGKKKYGVRVMRDGHLTHVGYFADEDDADDAYDDHSN